MPTFTTTRIHLAVALVAVLLGVVTATPQGFGIAAALVALELLRVPAQRWLDASVAAD